ncbi:hypothetical protein ACFZBU_38345 [Embleya sp. NPDC008237]|uniref:hypothetical protein n=1 Tax=Embleya sp. NPDC008237 TaxID=3363978 RepID=UPI0036EF715C
MVRPPALPIALKRAPRFRHIVASASEHKAVIEPLAHLRLRGFEVDFLSPGTNRRVEVEAIRERLQPN